jgi:hypothetical protein
MKSTGKEPLTSGDGGVFAIYAKNDFTLPGYYESMCDVPPPHSTVREDKADLERYLQQLLEDELGMANATTGITRLRGGTKKGVYRAVADGRSVILYVWNPYESYWPIAESGNRDAGSDPFSDASGADLFFCSHQCLKSLGVRTPELYFLDTSRTTAPADAAIVEDIQGGTLEECWLRCPDDLPRLMCELRDMLQVLHARHNSHAGMLAYGDARTPTGMRCEELALRRAIAHLDHAASHIGRLRSAQVALEDALQSLASVIAPRSEYSLIHGELGPEHVLVDERGHPAIIDIEGLMYFDVEWEHAYLAFRFDQHYHWLREVGLDEARRRFYTLCLHVSLCSGPLRLLEGDFPERDMMAGIIEWNTAKALDFVR